MNGSLPGENAEPVQAACAPRLPDESAGLATLLADEVVESRVSGHRLTTAAARW
jgi:hypothetical protein